MFFIDRHHFKNFDWFSCIIMMLIASIGLLFIFSATYTTEQPYSVFFKKQLFGVASGFGIYILFSLIDYRTLMRCGYFAYFGVIGLLIFTIIKGHIGMGAQRWINLVFFKLQPSELAKLLFPAFTAYYLQTHDHKRYLKFRHFMPILLMLIISFILILKQPDLGTALVLLFSGILMLWLAGIKKKFFFYGALFVGLTAPISWYFLKPYQKRRVLVFLGEGDIQKERYHIEQSKIAIGSGGFLGKGFLNGTQNRYMFLPESRTDFIFAVVCEEWGFLGALLILILFTLLFVRQLFIIQRITMPFVQLLAVGIIIPIILSAFINIAMVLGLLPVVGIPLPLMSYGLSNLWITFASLGWLNNIAMHRLYYDK